MEIILSEIYGKFIKIKLIVLVAEFKIPVTLKESLSFERKIRTFASPVNVIHVPSLYLITILCQVKLLNDNKDKLGHCFLETILNERLGLGFVVLPDS